MDCSMPGFPVLHYLLKFAQIHIHGVGNVIQPSHPLLPPSPQALSLSQHQSLFPVTRLFASGGQNIVASASASVLLMNIQGWFPLGLTSLISLLSKRFSSLLQHHNSKASILWCNRQLSKPWYIHIMKYQWLKVEFFRKQETDETQNFFPFVQGGLHHPSCLPGIFRYV